MRLRSLTAAAVLALAVAGLAGCRSNVGTAATVNGHRIGESDVSKYLTPNAESVPQQNQTGATSTVPARTWVLRTLVNTEVFGELLRHTPAGAPTEGQLAQAQTTLLQGTSPAQVADQYAQHGYQRSFAPIYLREQAIEQLLSAQLQNGVDAQKLLAQSDVKVSVSPRYGSFDPRTLEISGDPKAGLPDFLTIGGGSADAAG